MAFIQPVFIRKNTPGLRKKLEGLGYKLIPNGRGIWNIPIDELNYLKTIDGGLYCGVNGRWESISIDCGTNEELFLALAAMRDDTPINSYYWFKGKLVKCESLELKNLSRSTAQYLLKCRYVDNTMIVFCTEEKMLRKATVKEIIEHFKER